MIKILYLLAISQSRFARNPKSASCSYQSSPTWLTTQISSTQVSFTWEIPYIEDTIISHNIQGGTPSSIWCSSTSIGMVNWADPVSVIPDFLKGKNYVR